MLFRCVCLIISLAATAFSQPAFDSAEIRPSNKGITPSMTGGAIRGGRYELRQATMLDLISTAWNVDSDKVIGGPSWLERDRFDVVAKASPSTAPETMRLMLRTLLQERFHLILREDEKPLPAFVLTVGKRPQLKPAGGAGDATCQFRQQSMKLDGRARNAEIVCRNMTMASFAARIRGLAASYVPHPVLDQTGLTGAWDFNLTWTAQQLLVLAGADGITFAAALNKQLGLKLELQNISMPVLAVDSVNQNPDGNPPGTTQANPPAPVEFEAADIRPSEPGTQERTEFLPGGRMKLNGVTLKQLIQLAWNIKGDDMLADAPKWLETDRYDVLAKAPATTQTDAAKGPPIDIDALRVMMRTLLVDRFHLTAHNEERQASVHVLLAQKPKLRAADTSNRMRCTQATGNTGTGTSTVSTHSYTCQNTTMKQFALELQNGGMGDIKHPVVDSTGLDGAWDFVLTWTPRVFSRETSASDTNAVVSAASDPVGGYSLTEAIEKELGLKLEVQKRPVSVLVIDHVDQKPDGN